MKNGINSYYQIRKRKIKRKYNFPNFIIIIFLSKFILLNEILNKPIRNLIQFDSEIHLVIQSKRE